MELDVQDAMTMWCPFSRGYEPDERGGGVAINRPAQNSAGEMGTRFRCIADQCMAWRWIADDPGSISTYGYCGLAGKPESA